MLKLVVAAALAAITLPSPVAAEPAVVASAERRMDHISVIKTGSGSPVVLIPGLASPRAVWSAFLPALAKGHTVYLVQVNGFGGDAPGKNVEPAILDGIVADLGDYLEQERAKPARIVGHSLGGLVGLMFARAHPDQVERLMIVDALPYFPAIMSPGGEAPALAAVEPIARTMRDRIAARHGKPADKETLRAETARLATKPDSQASILEWAAAADPRVTGQLLYEDMTTDLRPALAEIRTPITLIYPWSGKGAGEAATPAFYQRQYAGTPKISFVGVADAGHFAMLDQPGQFSKLLDSFLE